jgi:hypothetical protein
VSPALDQIAATLARMFVFGPMVFLGLMWVMNPASLTSLLADLEDGVRRFKLHLQGRWADPFARPVRFHATDRAEGRARLAGALLVVAGLLGMLELLG